MDQTYNPDGSRNRSYRPYIAFEQTTYDTSIYDPSRSQIYGLYQYGVWPSSITTQKNIEEYRLLRDSSGLILQNNPISRTYADIATYPPNLVRNVYTYHTNTSGNQIAYKNLYAM
jgi:hypothetical protein